MKKKRAILVLLAVIAVAGFSACDNPWWPEKDQGTLNYNANGGTGTVPKPQTASLRSTIRVASQNGLTRNGYNFYGWNTRADGTGTNYVVGAAYTVNGDATLFAKWVADGTTGPNIPNNTNAPGTYDPGTGNPANPQANSGPPYKVTYMAGNYSYAAGSSPPKDTKNYPIGDDVPVLGAGSLVLEGYTLVGWGSLGGPLYKTGKTFKITADTVLYPEWVKISEDLVIIEEELFATEARFYGYDPDDKNLEKSVTITNNTGNDLAPLYLSHLSGNLDKFILHTDGYDDFNKSVNFRARATDADKLKEGSFATGIIKNGDSVIFKITAKGGMDVGDYFIKCSINDKPDGSGKIGATFYMSFQVNAIPLKVEVTDKTYTNPGNVLTPIVSDNSAKPSYTEREASFVVTVSGFKEADLEDAKSLALEVGSKNAAGYIVAINGLSLSGTGDGMTKLYTKDGDDFYKKTFDNVKVILSDTHEFATGKAEVFFGFVETPELIKKNYETLSMTEQPEVIDITDGWTAARPIPIKTVNTVDNNGFNYYANTTNGLKRHYIQKEGIVLPVVGVGQSNWTAIGTSATNAFTGSYDGRGYTISNLTASGAANQGMFGYIKGATVKNLGLVNVNITATTGENAGGVAGYNESGIVEYCYVENAVIKADSTAGGIVGTNAVKATVRYCYVMGSTTITANVNNAGGVAGSNNQSMVEQCYTTNTDVCAENDGNNSGRQAGGIVGWNNGTVRNCYVSGGEVRGATYVGGIVGRSNAPNAITTSPGPYCIVEYCYSTAAVFSPGTSYNKAAPYSDFAGGVVGQSNHVNGKVQNNVALNPSVTAPGLLYVGRVVGRVSEHNVVSISGQTNNYARSSMTGNMTSASYVIHGTLIDASKWDDTGWWTTPGNWTGGAWNTGVWNITNASLPTLKMTGIPGGTPAQSPVVP